MEKKILTAILAFVTTFGSTVAINGYFNPAPEPSVYRRVENPTAQRITELLRQDVNDGEARNVNSYSAYRNDFELYAEGIELYVDKSSSMDDSDLPADFRAAWRQHMKAWRKQANLTTRAACEARRANVTDADEFEVILEKRGSSKVTEEINSTWATVLTLAREHGARLPSRY